MATLVATTNPATGSVLVELDRQLVIDNFTRVEVAGWGTAAPLGGAYTVLGGAANFNVNGRGDMITTVTNTAYRARQSTSFTDVDMRVFVSVPGPPTGAPIDVGIMGRYQTATGDNYEARVRLSPGGVLATLSLQYGVVNSFTPLTAEVDIPNFNVGALSEFWIQFTISGDQLRAKAWRFIDAEPQEWLVEARNTSLPSGTVGLISVRNTGNTNGAVTVQFDDWSVLASVEPLNLWRVTPDGTQTLVRGSGFFTVDPVGTATIWDNEAPFDVNIFYVLRSSDSTNITVTSNTVSLASGGDVWLRDPYNPSNNIIIEISDVPFDYCDDTPRIMFSGLGRRTYGNASGIFDIIDAQRPETIAQLRKRYASTLILSSKEAADGEAIEAIIAGGYPLLLSLPTVYQFGLPYGTDWITIFDIEDTPVGVDLRVPARVWTMPFKLSDVPADVDTGNTGGNGVGGGDATYDVLAASVIGLTYTALAAAGFTYDDIAAGTGY